jgi:superoxide reductase
MMNRRGFIRLGALGSVAGLFAPRWVLAGGIEEKLNTPLAGGVYYTKEAPGRWAKKVGGHLPTIETQAGAGGALQVRVVTSHEMKGYEHYIVKHILLNENLEFIEENRFDPMRDKAPISTFTLASYSGPLYALSMCNKHDVWINGVGV